MPDQWDTLVSAPDDLVASIEARLRTVQEELARCTAELGRANADLADFASVVGHDLRGPLQVIEGFAELLSTTYGEALDDRGREWIGHIQRAGRSGAHRITDLLTFARIGSAGTAHERVPLDRLVRAVADEAVLGDGSPDAVVEVSPLPDVVGDQALIRQLLHHLLGNALKFRRPWVPPHVLVDARQADGTVVLQVTDNGVGIPAEERDRVFGILYRFPAGSDLPGTGIGLAVARRIVERHGGRIWIEGTEAGGTRVCAELPAAEADA